MGGTGEVGGAADLLDPSEARFWRALPGEGDGTYVARAAALRHPVLRCFVRLRSLECPKAAGLAPMRARRVRGCDGESAEGVEVVMPPHERDKASAVASKHFCKLLLTLQADGGCTHLAFTDGSKVGAEASKDGRAHPRGGGEYRPVG